MIRSLLLCTVVLGLSACNGTNPFMEDAAAPDTTTDTGSTTEDTGSTTTDGGTSTDSGTGDSGEAIASDRTLLPGTSAPSASGAIFRREARSGEDADGGNGYAESVRYDSATDRFYVDNLAFDGTDGYTPVINPADGSRLGIGPFTVFESPATAVDSLTLASIDQLVPYRALYGIGPSGDTSIAIIRTGAYVQYGFGGYVFQRDKGVVLPTTGQALYTGTNNYGGLRDFNNRGGLEYVQGDMEVSIDFDDFNNGAGVRGYARNRRVFDMNGNDITGDILAKLDGSPTALPVLQFKIAPGVLDSNGEIAGDVASNHPSGTGTLETGTYYAVLSGDNAEHITGVVVVTSSDPRYGGNVRETGGFFASRQ